MVTIALGANLNAYPVLVPTSYSNPVIVKSSTVVSPLSKNISTVTSLSG